MPRTHAFMFAAKQHYFLYILEIRACLQLIRLDLHRAAESYRPCYSITQDQSNIPFSFFSCFIFYTNTTACQHSTASSQRPAFGQPLLVAPTRQATVPSLLLHPNRNSRVHEYQMATGIDANVLVSDNSEPKKLIESPPYI
ncbi:hypothetical protein L6452_22581 [Arctium lappa]|uniref:Uncharacterized protein n=1 Tax=Arctium lappa TaxID=4217 RepID=A0ACB9B092_ARCLA|nr:hypothetical protein L6452_22581 [Arctium lappa]